MVRRNFLLCVAAVLAVLSPLARAQQPEAPPVKAEDPRDLVVMSFNIRYGTAKDGDNAWPSRRQLVIDRIRAHKADIVGLQEALRFQIDELLAAMPEYKSVGVGRDDGKDAGEHAAILYRRELLELAPIPPTPAADDQPATGNFWYSDSPERPGSKSWGNRITRICTWARFRQIGTSAAFFVFNTHFDHESQPSREKSAELLLQRIAERSPRDPVIVTGDFNAGESNPAVTAILAPARENAADKPRLRDSFRMLHPDEKTVGTFNGFKNTTGGDKIDYVFIDDAWEVLEASIDRTMPDGRLPSDHFPVVAKVRLRVAAPSTPEPGTTRPASP